MSTPTARPQTITDEGMSRRALLQGSAAGGVGLALSGSLSALFGPEAALAHGHGHGPHKVGYGPLVPDPAGHASLPEGFHYTVVAESGVTRLETGEPTPDDSDGTASFVRRGGNGSVLVANHEIGGGEPYGVPALAGLVYDPGANGGTTNIEVDKHGRRVREYVSLAGTHTNCAGGRDAVEHLADLRGDRGDPSASRTATSSRSTPTTGDANRDPKPIKALGRFAHEAVRRSTRTGHASTRPRTPATRTACSTAGPRRARRCRCGKGSLRKLADDAGALEALKAHRGGRASCRTSVSRRSRARRTASSGSRCPTATPPRRSTRKQFSRRRTSPAAASSRAPGGATAARTSSRRSPAPTTAARSSTTARCGSTTRVDDTITLKLRFAYTPADQDTTPTGRTTSRSRRTAA